MSNKFVIQQPTPMVQTTTSNQWSSGICECTSDIRDCCLAFWCHSCHACLTTRTAGECLCLPLLDACPIPPIALSLRAVLRQRYGIEGTVCNDCVMTFFCRACAWCQMSREMKTRHQPITLINAHNL